MDKKYPEKEARRGKRAVFIQGGGPRNKAVLRDEIINDRRGAARLQVPPLNIAAWQPSQASLRTGQMLRASLTGWSATSTPMRRLMD